MTSRDGRQLLERVLEHLNYERAIARPHSKAGLIEWYAYVEASFTCTEIIRNWHRPAFARKVAA